MVVCGCWRRQALVNVVGFIVECECLECVMVNWKVDAGLFVDISKVLYTNK